MKVRAPRLERVLAVACAALAAWVLAGLVLLSAVHVDDRYRLAHVSGAWMTLARYLAEGTLYAPLYDGERFGGTRFMPLQFVLHGGLAKVTGEYLVSGKLVVLAAAVALAVVTFLGVRHLGAPWWLGLALVALVVPTHTGLTAMTSIRGDTLPVALQVGALLAFDRWRTRRGTTAAALLCTAALLSKISALWAPAAIVACLVLGERRRLAWFAAVFVPATAAALTVVELLAGGRFSDNVLGLSAAALSDPGEAVAAITTKPMTLIDSDAAAVSIVLPLAVADLAIAARGRRLSVFHLAFAAAVGVTLVVMLDVGAVSNHLLDLEILTVLLLAHLFANAGAVGVSPAPVVAVAVPIAVLWATLTTYVLDMHGDVRAAAHAVAGRGPDRAWEEPLGGVVPRGASLLSEDPTVAIGRGRTPTVLDPFMLLRILRKHPEWEADLVRRIERREFDRVVLFADHVRPDGSIEVEHPRWRREHFGQNVVAAIARSYRFRSFAGGYAVYARR